MKQTMLAVAITIASTQAFATNFDITNPYNHVTQPQLKETNKNLADTAYVANDARLKAFDAQNSANLGIQVGESALKAASTVQTNLDKTNTNVSNLNNKVDSYAAQGATAYNEIKGVQNAQQSQLNNVQDAAQQANVKADSAHVRLDSVETNLGNVQTAAQIANDRATSLESRTDVSENAIRETNGAVQSVNADLQSSKAAGVAIATGLNDKIDNVASQGAAEFTKTNNKVKAVDDKVNTAIGVQSGINANQANTNTQVQGQLSSVQTSAQNAQSTANVALSVGVSNTASIAKNTTDIQTNAQGISKNTSDIKDVSARVTGTEQVNTRQEARLDEHGTAINRNTVQLGQHAQVLNEYGTQLDNQDAMNSRFAADLGNVKSQVNGMQSQLNSQGKRIGQVENGLAMVAATAAIQFNTDPEAGFQAGCGVAQIRSNTGSACAVGGAINKNWFVSGYVMQASSTSGVAASATYSWGR